MSGETRFAFAWRAAPITIDWSQGFWPVPTLLRRILATAILWIAISAPVASAQFLPKSFYDNRVHDIRQGGEFGIKIGMDAQRARKALESHWNIHVSGSTNDCKLLADDCDGIEVIDHFDVGGDILGGRILLFVADGKIARMVWWRKPFDP